MAEKKPRKTYTYTTTRKRKKNGQWYKIRSDKGGTHKKPKSS